MKKTIAIILSCLMVLALVACVPAKPATSTNESKAPAAEGPATQEKAPESASKEDSEGIVLHIASQKVEWAESWDKLKEAYLASHPEIADIEYTLVSGQDLFTQLKAMLQTGSFPDVTQIQDGYKLLSWAEHLLPLNDYPEMFAKLPSETLMSGFTAADGTIYGVPTHTEAWGVLYNMDILGKVGVTEVPQTKSEFIDVCEKLVAAGLPTGVNYFKENSTWNTHTIVMMGVGSELGSADFFKKATTTPDLDFANDVGINTWVDFIDTTMKYGNHDALTTDRATAQAAFYNEEYAYIFLGGTWNNSQILDVNPDLLGHVQIGPVPLTDDASRNQIAGITQGMSIHKNSPHVEEAVEWMTWLVTSEEAAEILVNTSSVAVCRTDVTLTAENVGVLPAQADVYMKEGRISPLYTGLSTECTEKILIASQKYVGKQIDRATFIAELEAVFESVSK